MPLISKSHYQKPFYFFFSDMETIVPSMFNSEKNGAFQKERMTLSDEDFIDLDWVKTNSRRLLILSHGLEGSSRRHYMVRSARYFSQRGWDVLAWNYRSCGPDLNLLPKTYYYGGIEDYEEVIQYALSTDDYDQVVLIGFSMGGCLVNKYLGSVEHLDPRIKGAVSFSVSCDLKDTIDHVENNKRIYRQSFLKKILEKLNMKIDQHESLKHISVDSMEKFEDYIVQYILPNHHLKSVEEFYELSSCKNFFKGIQVPSLIVNAQNDPILFGDCYPFDLVENLSSVYLESPSHGGHLGFTLLGESHSWMEERTEQFIDEVILKNA